MDFSIEIFHQSPTSRLGHLRLKDDTVAALEAPIFGLLHVHAPPTVPAYATLHLVDPQLDLTEELSDILDGLHRLAAAEMELELMSFLVTRAVEVQPGPGTAPEADLLLERHRPSGDSTRDLVLEDTGNADEHKLIAIFERFRQGAGSVNVLAIVDDRFWNEGAVNSLMRVIDGNLGPPTGDGEHHLEVLTMNFLGQFGAAADG